MAVRASQLLNETLFFFFDHDIFCGSTLRLVQSSKGLENMLIKGLKTKSCLSDTVPVAGQPGLTKAKGYDGIVPLMFLI